MKLITKTSPTNIGMMSKKIAWLFDYQLQLTIEETNLVRTYQYGDVTVGTWGESNQYYITVNQACTGKKGHCFQTLGLAMQFEASLIQGCKGLGTCLEELRRIAGGAERIYEIGDNSVQLLSFDAGPNRPTASQPPPLPGGLPPVIQPQPGLS